MAFLKDKMNELLGKKEPTTVVLLTILSIIIGYYIIIIINLISKYGIKSTIEYIGISLLKQVPGGNKILSKEIEKNKTKMFDSLLKQIKPSINEYFELPKKGVSREVIREELMHQLSLEKGITANKSHGGLYTKSYDSKNRFLDKNSNKFIDCQSRDKLLIKEEAYLMFQHTNILYPFLYPGTRKFDTEIISMVSKLLNSKVVVGSTTSGGTESIYMAMYCYREYAKNVRNVIHPEVIVGISAHPAFFKACHALNIKIHVCNVNPKTYDVNLSEMKSYINKNTIALVGSAPGFPHGVIDDIKGICNIAKYNGIKIPVHVDNCLGGFVLSFLDEYIDKLWDFRCNGVTSISVDLHKHGGAPKGLSCIIYNNKEIWKHQIYSYVNWPGGMYVSPTFRGSANGGILAAGWSMLINNGYESFKHKAVSLYNAQQKLIKEMTSIDNGECIEIIGGNNKNGTIIAFKFKDEYASKYKMKSASMAQAMKIHFDWDLNILQYPFGVHIQMGQRQINDINNNTFINNLTKCIELIKSNPNKYYTGNAQIYGAAAKIADRTLVAKSIASYAEFVATPFPNKSLKNM